MSLEISSTNRLSALFTPEADRELLETCHVQNRLTNLLLSEDEDSLTPSTSSGSFEPRLLRLPGCLFGKILLFLTDKEKDKLTTTSVQTDGCRWNAHILEKMPQLYSLYRDVIGAKKSCRDHFHALCKTQALVKTKSDGLKDKIALGQVIPIYLENSQNMLSPIREVEPRSHLVLRDAFPKDWCSRGWISRPRPLTLCLDLGSGKAPGLVAHKLYHGRYYSGMLGERRFYVIGENHTHPKDLEFFSVAVDACKEDRIALFREGVMAFDLIEQRYKTTLGIPSTSTFRGLESPGSLQLINQVLVWNLSDLFSSTAVRPEEIPHYWNNLHYIIFTGLLSSLQGQRMLKGALKINIQDFPPEKRSLAQAISDTMDWGQISRGSMTLIPDHLQKIQEVWQNNLPSRQAFFTCLARSLLKETPSLFSETAADILRECIDTPSSEGFKEALEFFMQDRDAHFVENILKELPSIPTSKPLVIILGFYHQSNVFSWLQRCYYRSPEKYAYGSKADILPPFVPKKEKWCPHSSSFKDLFI